MAEQAKPAPKEDFQHLVRIMNTDIPGERQIAIGLTKIKGVSMMFSNMICNLCQIDKTKKTGTLSETEINRLDEAIRNPSAISVPTWMLNRRNDYETGENKHLLKGDLDFVQSNDLKRLKMIKCYRGSRHAVGAPARGQRTKSNFRRNKGKVTGVKRKGKDKGGAKGKK